MIFSELEYHFWLSFSPFSLTFNTSTLRDDPDFIAFGRGKWLEIYTYTVFAKHYRTTDGCMKHLDFTLVNGKKGEFDLIYLHNEQLIIIECQTGDYSEKIPKYQEICQTLHLSRNQFIVVIRKTSSANLSELSMRHQMTFTDLHHLKKVWPIAGSSQPQPDSALSA